MECDQDHYSLILFDYGSSSHLIRTYCMRPSKEAHASRQLPPAVLSLLSCFVDEEKRFPIRPHISFP